MAYGTLKVDNITFTNGGIDQTITVSGIVQSISGDITATGTIQAATVIGTTTVSGATVTGNVGQFTTVAGGSASFTTVTGTTVTGTTANFGTGVFTTQVSGVTVIGTTVSGGIVRGTTISGATVQGTTVSGTTITGGALTVASGTFTGNSTAAAFIPTGSTVPTNGIYLPSANTVAVATNGAQRLLIDANGQIQSTSLGTAAAPSWTFVGDLNTGLWSPTADTLAASTNGTERLRITSAGLVGIGTSSPDARLSVVPSAVNTPALIIPQAPSAVNNDYVAIRSKYAVGNEFCCSEIRFGVESTPSGTGFIQLATGNNVASPRLHITSAGNVGVGTTSPLALLNTYQASGGSEAPILFQNFSTAAGTSVALYLSPSGGNLTSGNIRAAAIKGIADSSNIVNLAFFTNSSGADPTERARIDSSGRLLVGTSSAVATSTITPGLQHHQTTVQDANAGFGRWTGDSGGYAFYFAKSRGTSVQSHVIVNDNDFLGALFFEGSDGTAFKRGAAITANVDGTPGANDMPGRLVFSTTADGASSPTERLRICEDGTVTYNQPAPTSKSAAATLTVAELKTGIIQYTGAAATLTLPTGTLTEGGFSSIYTNMTFEWSVINTGSGTCTIGAGSGHTIVGGATIVAGASGRFASRRTAANTFVSYRLS